MPRYTLVVDRLADWKWPMEEFDLISADAYLARGQKKGKATPRVINLCRRYGYLTAGYYCSLLAEARGQVPMPTVADVLSLTRKRLYAFAIPVLERLLSKTLRKQDIPPTTDFDINIFFGRPDDPSFKRLASETFDIFRFPVLRLRVEKTRAGSWKIGDISPIGLHQVPEHLQGAFFEALSAYTRTRGSRADRPQSLYDLAILYDPSEVLPPSDKGALERFIRIGQELRIDVELITRKDFRRIPEFDALFIRTCTAIDHYTYQFARKAEQEGLVVMDDPGSILRCTNKVYLHEMLVRHGLPTPKCRSISRLSFDESILSDLEEEIGYPMVIKIPDGSFSRGVLKAENRDQLRTIAETLLQRSRLILAQEYVYTKFDWRVGVLNGELLFVCQYMMSPNHWQIVKHKADGSFRQGGFKTLALADAPREVIEIGSKAAAMMGNGLYGVDLKETDSGIKIIEVNDNPNLDSGVEDKVLKSDLYKTILNEFIRRINAMT